MAQFYHFAFMIVSIALLGIGASGTALTIFPALRKGEPRQRLSQLAFATAASILIAFALINYLPFDSFSIAWDRRQAFVLILHYIVLAAPFFFAGMALGYLLNAVPRLAGTAYAVNLFGSALGCLFALAGPSYLGGEGMLTLSAALAASGAWISSVRAHRMQHWLVAGTLSLLLFCLLDLGLRLAGRPPFAPLELRISPYKSLSYALQYPGSRVIYREWNAFSRVDVVRSNGIHSVPGLSYRFLQPLPPLDGLLVDGDDLNPIPEPSMDSAFTAYLPNAVAFQLRPQATALILEPRGGLDLFTALALSSGQATVVEINPLIVHAVPIYQDPRIQVHVESDRSYLSRTAMKYDVIVLSLAASFHPVSSGAYALAEDFRYTTESFEDILAHLSPGGLLVATRWLQDPPSEDLRLFALAVTALENSGGNPREQIVAFRGFNTATILVRNGAFTSGELETIRGFLGERAFDLTYAPGVRPSETNLYNILPESEYYQTYLGLLDSQPREEFYARYEYDIRPPTDDHPFFGHYFKWTQASQIMAQFGRAWQPFGGAGYFVIVALLALAILLAALLILLPLVRWRRIKRNAAAPFSFRNLLYFGLLGFAFLFVEIPLLQRFILYLGQPAYAFTVVLFSLLFFSGWGSRFSRQIPLRPSLAILAILILAVPLVLPRFFALTLGLPLAFRLGLASLVLCPLGFLMGIPFPAGIAMMREEATPRQRNGEQAGDVPWVWAVNGAASVVASILAALFVLTFGLSAALMFGALCYAGAWLTVWGPVEVRAARLRGRSEAQS